MSVLIQLTPNAKDLIAVEILRTIGAIDNIIDGDLDGALSPASRRWAVLPKGAGKPGKYHQPYMKYDDFSNTYKSFGGTTK